LVRGDFFFFYSKFRIAGWENKTANFVGWEAMIYQWLLLWISGGKLTKIHEYQVQASRRPLAATRFTSFQLHIPVNLREPVAAEWHSGRG
jgi:hypothetical protein